MAGPDFEKLTQGNYDTWAPFMEALLVDKDVWDVIEGDGEDGEIVEPPVTQGVRLKAFRRKQQVARAAIVLRVDASQLPHTRFATPREIWLELKRVHTSRGFASKLALRRRFFSMRKAPNQQIQAWAAEVRHIGYLLERADFELDEMDRILALTQGLPEEYNPLIVALDSSPAETLTFEGVLERLLNEESRQLMGRLTVKAETEEALAVVPTNRRSSPGKRPSRKGVRCHLCKGMGHYRSECPSQEEDVNLVEDKGNRDQAEIHFVGETGIFDEDGCW